MKAYCVAKYSMRALLFYGLGYEEENVFWKKANLLLYMWSEEKKCDWLYDEEKIWPSEANLSENRREENERRPESISLLKYRKCIENILKISAFYSDWKLLRRNDYLSSLMKAVVKLPYLWLFICEGEKWPVCRPTNNDWLWLMYVSLKYML